MNILPEEEKNRDVLVGQIKEDEFKLFPCVFFLEKEKPVAHRQVIFIICLHEWS